MEFIVDVSVIIPIHNGEKWIDECFISIKNQTAIGKLKLEICITNDASTDNTEKLIKHWIKLFKEVDINILVYENSGHARGVGYAKNCAVTISSGKYLCFQDVDDIMLPSRIEDMYDTGNIFPDNTLIGSKFIRKPLNSTGRYTKWANNLSNNQLMKQIYTSHGPTIIMPTWFCHRNVFDSVGGFSENGRGTPEDLIFFYNHLDKNGQIYKIDKELLIYRYHIEATTFSIHEDTIWKIRLERLEKCILSKWQKFTIWNAGKQGRKFFNSLCTESKEKVGCFCDVDVNKINKEYVPFNPATRLTGRPIKIVHFSKAEAPFVICVKQDMTNGQFESNLESLDLIEGNDYVYF